MGPNGKGIGISGGGRPALARKNVNRKGGGWGRGGALRGRKGVGRKVSTRNAILEQKPGGLETYDRHLLCRKRAARGGQ